MKIIVTGSLGHISKPLVEELLQKGHEVTVISSKPERQKEIEALGATASIGSMEDVEFLTKAFNGADAVYCMIARDDFFNQDIDMIEYYARVGNNYAQAIQRSAVKRVVYLSSIGAHLDIGTGLILAHNAVEKVLSALPGIAITFMRPTAFHYNLYSFIPAIKNTGAMTSNYGADDKVIWVSPTDIAAAVAEEIVTPLIGRKVRYVASDELTCNEVAAILGRVIGKPDLKWLIISSEQMQIGLESVGMSPKIAAGLVQMQACMHGGHFFDDYYLNRPGVMGKIKMTDFANDFAAAFNK